MWEIPESIFRLEAEHRKSEMHRQSESAKTPDRPLPVKVGGANVLQPALFDGDKCVNCSVDGGHCTVTHSVGGRGYALASTALTSGCYHWKVSERFPLLRFSFGAYFKAFLVRIDRKINCVECVVKFKHFLPSGARCSSVVVRAFAHGAMGLQIDPSWGEPIELFLVPVSAPQLV